MLLCLGRLELRQLLQDLDFGLSLGSCGTITKEAEKSARAGSGPVSEAFLTSVGVVTPSIDVRLQMGPVGDLGVVLLLLRTRSLRLGRVELGEVSLVAVRRKERGQSAHAKMRGGKGRDELVETL